MATVPATATATICSSPPLPTIPSSLRTNHPCQLSPPASFSSIKLGSADVEAVGESSAVEGAAENALKEASKWGFQSIELEKRRKRRRRRRIRGFECLELEEENGGEETEDNNGVSFRSSRSKFLSPKEEAELCLCLKEGAKLETLGTKVAETQHNVEKLLYRRREAREKLTHCYRRLVVSIANEYQGKGINLQDLIQEGTIGLLRGAEKFDPERGNKLSTYVYWWIKQAILRAVAHKSRLVRLPGSMCGVMAKVAEASNVLSSRLRRTPTCEEIAGEVNLNVSEVRLALVQSWSPISLDRTVSDKGCMTLQEIVRGPDETTPEYMETRRCMRQKIEKLLKTVTARESCVLRLYFGLNGETPMSFEEIGKSMKLSRERVRQINGVALSKLRQVHNLNDLKMYIL